VNYVGIQKSAWLTRVIVAITLAVLVFVVVACLAAGHLHRAHLSPFPGTGIREVLESAGLLFFAFAGYARIATLGVEVRDPARTIPRAITTALAITFVVYAVVAVVLLLSEGWAGVAASTSPLRTAVAAGRWHALAPVVQVGAAVAALGSLLALILGVSRTTLAMARDHHLPGPLAAVHPRFAVPHRAELVVGAVVVVLVLTTDLRHAIGFSSFGVLAYYAIANASAATLTTAENRPPRWLPPLGLLGCTVVAFSLPAASIAIGAAVLAAGVIVWILRGQYGSTAS